LSCFIQIQEFLLAIQEKLLNQQKNELDSFFNNWTKNTGQIDDVLILGFNISESLFKWRASGTHRFIKTPKPVSLNIKSNIMKTKIL